MTITNAIVNASMTINAGIKMNIRISTRICIRGIDVDIFIRIAISTYHSTFMGIDVRSTTNVGVDASMRLRISNRNFICGLAIPEL